MFHRGVIVHPIFPMHRTCGHNFLIYIHVASSKLIGNTPFTYEAYPHFGDLFACSNFQGFKLTYMVKVFFFNPTRTIITCKKRRWLKCVHILEPLYASLVPLLGSQYLCLLTAAIFLLNLRNSLSLSVASFIFFAHAFSSVRSWHSNHTSSKYTLPQKHLSHHLSHTSLPSWILS